MSNEISSLCNQCITYIDNAGIKCNKNVFNVFDRLIRYFPESYNDQLISLIERIADVSKKYGFYENAEKYYSMMTGLDPSEHKGYWGLLQSKLKCHDNKELIHQNVLISTIPEFNNAIIAAGNNSDAVEEYIDCRAKQEILLKKKEKAKKYKRKIGIPIIAFFVLSVIITSMYALTKCVILPSIKYDEIVTLINKKQFQDAYDELIDFNFKDSTSQMSIAKAGISFENGDYKSGVKNIYDVGGTINISYDSNGGEVPFNNQTLKKESINLDNNIPWLYGYTFYGWAITSYSISTKYNDYYCNLSLKAERKIKNYSITYDLNGGTLENLNCSYNCMSKDFSLGQPNKKGYDFEGWSGTNIEGIKKDVVIPKGSIGNRHYEAHYKEKTYNVTYDYGYDNKSETTTATYGSQFETETPVREGYDFVGWSYEGNPFSNGKWLIDSDATLVANWSLKTYTITYELNGGNNSETNLNSYNIEAPSFSLSAPSKDGFDFVGWTGTDIDVPSKNVTIEKGSTGDRKYVANWKAHTYLVSLNSMGGDCDTSTLNVEYGKELILPKATRNGYKFAGWYNVEDNSLITDCVWNYLSDLRLYAKWCANTYTISYNLNGGINNNNNPNSYTIESDEITILNPTRDGYTFKGWSSILGTLIIEPKIVKGSYGDLLFTANWEANLNTIIFNGNSNTSGEMSSTQVRSDGSIKLPKNVFTKAGYHFIGWSISQMGSVKYLDEAIYNAGTELIINLYAVWEANQNTITYHGNGSNDGQMESQIISTGNIDNLHTNLFTKIGYHFVGWSKTKDGEVAYKENEPYLMGPESNYNLYAIWEPNSYKIYFDLNEGNSEQKQETVIYDSKYKLPVPSRAGYYFSGWYLGKAQLTDAEGNSIENYNISGDITVTAHWSPKTNIIILISDGNKITMEGLSDTIVRLKKDAFTKEGYELLGWSENENGELKYYNDDLYYVGINSSYTLYAVWKESQNIDFTGYDKISNKEEFLSFIYSTQSSSKKYYLSNDIDLEGEVITPKNDFNAVLDGNKKTISNFVLTIEAKPKEINIFSSWSREEYAYNYYFGFFKDNKGAIKNLNIDCYNYKVDFSSLMESKIGRSTEKTYYTSSYVYMGVICGINSGTISNCRVITPSQSFNLSIGGVYYIGGISGKDTNEKNDTDNLKKCFVVNNLSFSGTIRSKNYYDDALYTDNLFYFGSLIGYKEKGKINDSLIINNSNCNVRTEEKKGYNFVKTYYVHFGDYCGTNIEVLNCNKISKLDEYSNYICFIYDEKRSYQFVNGCSRVTLNKNTFTKPGYQFKGWSLKKDGEILYGDMEICSLEYGTKYLELYAIFNPLTFSITFNLNGGDGKMEKQNIFCDEKQQIQKNSFSKVGYHFIGWSLTSDGEIAYQDCDLLQMGAKDVTLYATWQANENHIIFHSNGGYGEMNSQIIHSDETVILDHCTFEPPEGYYFGGWSLLSNGEIDYSDCGEIKGGYSERIDLYAIWLKK